MRFEAPAKVPAGGLRTGGVMFHLALALAFMARPWLVVSDVHLLAHSRSTVPAGSGSDTNAALLVSALRAMRNADPNPAVVVLPGDFLAHHMRARDALPTMLRVARRFRETYPRARFVVALGNNDDPCGDYAGPPQARYLHAVAQAWQLSRAFERAGYYTLGAPQPGLRFVVLDDVYWSFRYRNRCGGRISPGTAEFRWLEQTLRATPRGVRNVVVMHIPPGIDNISTAMLHGMVIVPLLAARDNQRLLRLLTDPRNRVAFVIAGHTHFGGLRRAGDIPILVAPSISPIYSNPPRFETLALRGNATYVRWTFVGGRWARGRERRLNRLPRSCASTALTERAFAACAHLHAVPFQDVPAFAIGLAVIVLVALVALWYASLRLWKRPPPNAA